MGVRDPGPCPGGSSRKGSGARFEAHVAGPCMSRDSVPPRHDLPWASTVFSVLASQQVRAHRGGPVGLKLGVRAVRVDGDVTVAGGWHFRLGIGGEGPPEEVEREQSEEKPGKVP